MSEQPAGALTIGGTDPCGAFGTWADVKTFAAHGVHGMCAVTAVTAQNSLGWYGAEFMPPAFVATQMDAVLDDYGAGALKTGFLGRVETITAVAQRLPHHQAQNIVIDPVLVNAHGRPMFGPEVAAAYRQHLQPLATVLTPGLDEAAVLLGMFEAWTAEQDHEAVLARVGELAGPQGWVVVKSVPAAVNRIVDVVYDGRRTSRYPAARIETVNVSGSGDTLSAAIAAELARGTAVEEAIARARAFTRRAIARAAEWRLAQKAGPTANFLTAVGEQ